MCRSCRCQFSVLTGTAIGGTRISVASWLVLLLGEADGYSRAGAAAAFGVSYESAGRMLARVSAIRAQVAADGPVHGAPAGPDFARAALNLPPTAVAAVLAVSPASRGRARDGRCGPSASYGG